jgi:hypothetical protein
VKVLLAVLICCSFISVQAQALSGPQLAVKIQTWPLPPPTIETQTWPLPPPTCSPSSGSKCLVGAAIQAN